MGEIEFILIDKNEKRVITIHYMNLEDGILAALSQNPRTIPEFNQQYQTITGGQFYQESDKPKIPVAEVKRVLGLKGMSDKAALEHWNAISNFQRQNYKSFKPNQKTEYDIPDLSSKMLEDLLEETELVTQDEWDKVPESLKRKIRRKTVSDDGIVEVDLRTKSIRYLTDRTFNIPRSGKRTPYSLPPEWKIIEE